MDWRSKSRIVSARSVPVRAAAKLAVYIALIIIIKNHQAITTNLGQEG